MGKGREAPHHHSTLWDQGLSEAEGPIGTTTAPTAPPAPPGGMSVTDIMRPRAALTTFPTGEGAEERQGPRVEEQQESGQKRKR